MKARYFNPFTVPRWHQKFGFKQRFVEEASKTLILNFHNAILSLKYLGIA